MNAFIEKLLSDDFIWTAITSHLPAGRGVSKTDYIRFNCPMCVSEGESADRRGRGGVKRSSLGIGVSCFNCGFKTLYKAGDKLSRRMQSFLRELGLDNREVSMLAHKAFQLSRVIADSNIEVEHRHNHFVPGFAARQLPEGTLPILEWAQQDCRDEHFLACASYALSRYDGLVDRVMWSPDPIWRDRIILPFYFRGELVGWTGRLVIDATDENPRYMSEVPTDFLYNGDLISRRDRSILLMPEGVLDADAIDGISPLGAKVSPRQASWINEGGKTVIVIPDRDDSGQRLIDAALKYNWKVAFPSISRGTQTWWDEDCKDAADAVKRYGRLYTIRSIIETSTASVLEINVKRKWLL